MAKKSDTLSPRQRQSARIMREKAALKRRKEWRKRAQIVGGVAAVVLGLAGGIWIWKHNLIEKTTRAMVDGAYQITARTGFAVQAIYLEGRSRTSKGEIDAALMIGKGSPILQLSLDDLRTRLEAIPSVKAAAVERALPGTLHVRIVEREPVALWQHQGKIALVDDKGVVMTGLDDAPYRHLPLIVGEGAPQHVVEILTVLASAPDLAKRFVAAVWVGDRRWNVRLDNGIEIKLPEQHPEAAWKQLADMHTQQQLLNRDVRAIDLRAPGKLFIKLSPEHTPAKTVGAKET